MLEKKVLHLKSDLYDKHATVWADTETETKACLLYFHGGGLLYGNREDLPGLHINTLTKAGYLIAAFDYPLAPASNVEDILSDVCASITYFVENIRFSKNGVMIENGAAAPLPFFLWGRSAGAYLCLLAAANGKGSAPLGVVSYYGYGLLCDSWFNTPSSYYCALPSVDETSLKNLPDFRHGSGSLDTHYSAYVYARQTGKWLDLIYTGREKLFYLNYTLRACQSFPCPLFCAHSIQDYDVPYSEFTALADRFRPRRFVAPCRVHDFDRDESSSVTAELLEATIGFLDSQVLRD